MTPEKFRRATEEELEYLASLGPALQPKEGPEYAAVKALLNLAKSKGLDWRFLFEVAVAAQPKEWPKPPLSAVAPCDTLKEPPSQ